MSKNRKFNINHNLKIHPKYFKEVANGNKTFELRYDDRNYKVGDILILMGYDSETMSFDGTQIVKEITYICSDFEGLKEGWVILSIKDPS